MRKILSKLYRNIHWVLFAVFAYIAVFLTLNMHRNPHYFTYHSELWADKAGYFVYLPAALKYQFNPENFPDSIDKKTGAGFFLDYANGKVITKYTYGVAVLELPFFLAADVLAVPLGQARDGFSPVYHQSINIAAVFYLLMGMVLLRKYQRHQFRDEAIYAALLSIFLGTNLYYYAIEDSGMSHVYSFFLFAASLYLLRKTDYLRKAAVFSVILVGLVAGLVLLVRPVNAMFLLAAFFMGAENKAEVFDRLKGLFRLRVMLPMLIMVALIFLPQFVYWDYLQGPMDFSGDREGRSWYTYENEHFFWGRPKILDVWFSPYNGLFLYNPFYLIIVAAMVYVLLAKDKREIVPVLLFGLTTYVFSCWWDWGFGCSYGARSYVEYLAIFSMPLTRFYQEKIFDLSLWKRIIFTAIVVAMIIFHLKLVYKFDKCFYGGRDWDWEAFFKFVETAI